MELLLELPDGSKSLIPASWTDIGTAGMDQAGSGLVTLGSLADLLRVCQLIADLRGQAAGMSPCEAVATAITLLANVIAKAAAARGSGVVGDE